MGNRIVGTPARTWESDILKFIRHIKMSFELLHEEEVFDKQASETVSKIVQEHVEYLREVRKEKAEGGPDVKVPSIGPYRTEYALFSKTKNLDRMIKAFVPKTKYPTTRAVEEASKKRDLMARHLICYLCTLAGRERK